MIRLVQRRVPERHDGIADILVDRAVMLQHGFRHRRQEVVEQRGERGRLHLLRDRREIADVAEHDGEIAQFSAQAQQAWICRQPLDHRWGKVVAEGARARACARRSERRNDRRTPVVKTARAPGGRDRPDRSASPSSRKPHQAKAGHRDHAGDAEDGAASRAQPRQQQPPWRRPGPAGLAISTSSAQNGRSIRSPDRICSTICACTSTPGMAVASGVERKSSRPGALVPTNTMLPPRSAARPPVPSKPARSVRDDGRCRAAKPGSGGIGAIDRADVTSPSPIANRDDALAPADEHGALGSAGLDDIVLLAHGDAQRLGDQTGIDLPTAIQEQRHPPHDGVAVGILG